MYTYTKRPLSAGPKTHKTPIALRFGQPEEAKRTDTPLAFVIALAPIDRSLHARRYTRARNAGKRGIEHVKSCRFSRMQLELPFVTHITARHSAQRDDRHGADRTATGVRRQRLSR